MHPAKLHVLASTVSLALAFAPRVAAQTVFVSADLTTGANDGSSWTDAYQGSAGLHAALAAAPAGAEVWLTGGTYLPNDVASRCARYRVAQPGLTLRGGFTGFESSPFMRPERGSSPTFLSGDRLNNDDGTAAGAADNLSVVLAIEASGVTLERLDVRGGGADAPGCAGTSIGGAAVLAAGAAGGDLRLQDCSVELCFGSGVHVEAVAPSASPRLVDSTFRDIVGAGVSLRGATQGVVVDRCIFARCSAGLVIGAGWLPTTEVRNSLFHGCRAQGVLFSSPDADTVRATVRQCTMARNGQAGLEFDGGFPGWTHGGIDVVQSIAASNNVSVFGLGPQFATLFGSWIRAESSVVEGGWAGPQVIDASPQFINANAGDFRLQLTSPAIDRGRSADAGDLDLASQHRAVDVAGAPDVGPGPFDFVDLGAYERTGSIADHGDCPAVPNSTGRVGRVFARGSTTLSDDSVTLLATDLPPGQFGLWVTSRNLGLFPMAGGPGTLCISGAIGRFNGPGQIRAASAAGTIELPVDLDRIPQPAGFVAVQPGDTWRFQLWHRDVQPGGGPTSGITGLATVTFD